MHSFPQPFSVIRLDVDRLKALNTNFLHSCADEVLRESFSTLQNAVAPHQAYRLGNGDEAGAILPGVKLKHARRMAEETRAAVERTFGIEKWRLDDSHSGCDEYSDNDTCCSFPQRSNPMRRLSPVAAIAPKPATAAGPSRSG